MRCIFLEIVNNEMCGHVHTKNDSVFNCLSELLIRCGFETYTEFFGCRRKSFGKFRLYFTIHFVCLLVSGKYVDEFAASFAETRYPYV